MSKILVTGIGAISAIGNNVEEQHKALMGGYCGITNVNNIDSKYASIFPFGEIKITDNQFIEILKEDNHKGLSRTTLLALHAFEEAINISQLSKEELSSADTALICATTVGGMSLINELYRNATLTDLDSKYLYSYDYTSVARYMQEKYKMNGIVNTINTACSSSANALIYGANLIKNGFAKRAIICGVDSLAKFTINGFNSLRILSTDICKPFDAERNGLNLGEAAGVLILEKEEDCNNKKGYAILSGYSNANDAFHASALSENGDGPYLSMAGALASANITASEIQFINAHGTGTENNDEVESKAMMRIFNTVPPFASTKSNTGHTLGAAGAIEAVFSILNIIHQEIYPALNFINPIEVTGLTPVVTYKKHSIQNVMSNSFGFGGNCSSLIFSKP